MLNPQVLGREVPGGFAGMYARQPDMIVNTRIAGAEIPFGSPLMYGEGGRVIPANADFTAAGFVGVAACEIKPSGTQQEGQYQPLDPVPVFQRGHVNVRAYGFPEKGGAVYVRTAKSDLAFANEPVGAFTANEESGKTVALPNCQWGGSIDTNGIAELVILTRGRA